MASALNTLSTAAAAFLSLAALAASLHREPRQISSLVHLWNARGITILVDALPYTRAGWTQVVGRREAVARSSRSKRLSR